MYKLLAILLLLSTTLLACDTGGSCPDGTYPVEDLKTGDTECQEGER